MSDMVFLTPSKNYPFLQLQQDIIRKLFPESLSIVVDTTTKWPIKWWDWIKLARESGKKYYTHIDEDCFLLDRQQVINTAQLLNTYDLIGPPDGDVPYRRDMNSVAMNSFFMMGRVDSLQDIKDVLKVKGLKFDPSTHPVRANVTHKGSKPNFEPYYGFFWHLLNNNKRFKYLDVRLDERFSSSNPRLDSDSPDICMHMWYSRVWHQRAHQARYNAAKIHLQQLHQL